MPEHQDADRATDPVGEGSQPEEVEPPHVEDGGAQPPEEPAEAPVRDPRIAEALERLEALGERPPAEHVEVYEEIHRVLQESLSQAHGEQATRRGEGGQPGGQRP